MKQKNEICILTDKIQMMKIRKLKVLIKTVLLFLMTRIVVSFIKIILVLSEKNSEGEAKVLNHSKKTTNLQRSHGETP